MAIDKQTLEYIGLGVYGVLCVASAILSVTYVPYILYKKNKEFNESKKQNKLEDLTLKK